MVLQIDKRPVMLHALDSNRFDTQRKLRKLFTMLMLCKQTGFAFKMSTKYVSRKTNFITMDHVTYFLMLPEEMHSLQGHFVKTTSGENKAPVCNVTFLPALSVVSRQYVKQPAPDPY